MGGQDFSSNPFFHFPISYLKIFQKPKKAKGWDPCAGNWGRFRSVGPAQGPGVSWPGPGIGKVRRLPGPLFLPDRKRQGKNFRPNGRNRAKRVGPRALRVDHLVFSRRTKIGREQRRLRVFKCQYFPFFIIMPIILSKAKANAQLIKIFNYS